MAEVIHSNHSNGFLLQTKNNKWIPQNMKGPPNSLMSSNNQKRDNMSRSKRYTNWQQKQERIPCLKIRQTTTQNPIYNFNEVKNLIIQFNGQPTQQNLENLIYQSKMIKAIIKELNRLKKKSKPGYCFQETEKTHKIENHQQDQVTNNRKKIFEEYVRAEKSQEEQCVEEYKSRFRERSSQFDLKEIEEKQPQEYSKVIGEQVRNKDMKASQSKSQDSFNKNSIDIQRYNSDYSKNDLQQQEVITRDSLIYNGNIGSLKRNVNNTTAVLHKNLNQPIQYLLYNRNQQNGPGRQSIVEVYNDEENNNQDEEPWENEPQQLNDENEIENPEEHIDMNEICTPDKDDDLIPEILQRQRHSQIYQEPYQEDAREQEIIEVYIEDRQQEIIEVYIEDRQQEFVEIYIDEFEVEINEPPEIGIQPQDLQEHFNIEQNNPIFQPYCTE